jgi:Ca2+:H+ antiporter
MSLPAFFTWIVLRVETDIIGLDRYLCSRVYLHDPPGDEDNLHQHKDAPQELKEEEMRLATLDPEVSQWVAIPVLIAALALMAVTAEFVRIYLH